ncbi:hypothetical protein CPARK_000010700 [cyanobacterium endosymbiont of Braarudosphaera bigelowii]|uniref:Phosphodiester glycosidase domain-containing protein n=1 Tax=cyanobacterium endosymbiont of Braarudosphaera bigelowii TaxID=1285375 RepID=A0ABM7U3K9_9CHRO|nr:hypothetical protein CPARK_000010700 [cyanobacterium endosymbiont of Braarudosphaera bigelowii]
MFCNIFNEDSKVTKFMWYLLKLISILLLLELPLNTLVHRVGNAKNISSYNNFFSFSSFEDITNKRIHNINYSFHNSLLLSNENKELSEFKINLLHTNIFNNFTFSKIKHDSVYTLTKTILPKEIIWVPGVIWRQQFITVQNKKGYSIFPVNLLEINNKSLKVILKPITSNFNGQVGTSSLEKIAKEWQVIAAINGGFFNRNNKLPLGAIRQNNNWLSSPILERGAVGWNENGQFFIDNLSLEETLIMSNGKQITIQCLNSGYIQAGISRYTSEWGKDYMSFSNNEIIVSVQNDKVIGKQKSKNIKQSYNIPDNGYLLVIRKKIFKSNLFSIGNKLKIRSDTVPKKFNKLSHILGAGPLLINNGFISLNTQDEKFTKSFQKQKASRSAIGITSKEKIILVTVHNSTNSKGVNLNEMAQIMQKLGSISALNLDGGGSTSLVLGGYLVDRFPPTAAKVHNGIGVFISQ